MLRTSLFSVALLFLIAGVMVAQDKDKKKDDKTTDHKSNATITKVDSKKGTITVKMKDQTGKEVEKTFELTGEVMLYDDNGKTIRVADIDIFRSGDQVLLVEREGKLKEVRKDKTGATKDTAKDKKDK